MLVTIIFSFCHNVFCQLKNKYQHLSYVPTFIKEYSNISSSITLHYISSSITLHYISSSITLHYISSSITLHYISSSITLHYISSSIPLLFNLQDILIKIAFSCSSPKDINLDDEIQSVCR